MCVCETHVAGEGVLQLGDGVGHRHWRGAWGQAEVGVLGADAELDGRHGQDVVHVDVHPVDGRDGAVEPLHALRAFPVLKRTLVTDWTRLMLLILLRARIGVLEEKREEKINQPFFRSF